MALQENFLKKFDKIKSEGYCTFQDVGGEL
jgi:hypothetical protein